MIFTFCFYINKYINIFLEKHTYNILLNKKYSKIN
uniref:Uncharacterized protein n=1 Tax=Caloglossa monosticha TaxID=76906 RepID=A0A1Z1M4X0_9FLOR|nr:hypothetical protein [Caloglossa monosticha]ARW60950.1 hypothetical protein [Caloglossa monosticha]